MHVESEPKDFQSHAGAQVAESNKDGTCKSRCGTGFIAREDPYRIV